MDEFEFLKELQSIEYDLLGLIRRMPLDFRSSYGLKGALEKAASETARATHEAHIQQAIKSYSEELAGGAKGIPQSDWRIPREVVVEALKNQYSTKRFGLTWPEAARRLMEEIAKELGISGEEIGC